MKYVIGNIKKKFLSGISYFIFHVPSPRGFTLVEMIVSFGIFAIIMVIAVGSFISLIGASSKAQAQKTVINNLHFALENISRNLRTGSVYHCNVADGMLKDPLDCPQDPASSIVFTARDGKRVAYKYTPVTVEGTYGTIDRAVVGVGQDYLLADQSTYVPITAPEVHIEQLRFYVDGSGPTDNAQPRVLIVVMGSTWSKGKVISRFNIETMVSQRLLDVAP